MAAPTNVRVESNSLTTATLRWTYPGSNNIDVYRSTDGASYSRITDGATNIAPGTTSYADSSLAVGTKYWYKLSDDVGSTFSSVVTVVTQSCLPPAGSGDTFSLPKFGEGREPVPEAILHGDPGEGLVVMNDWLAKQSEDLNNLSERIESVLGGRVLVPEECIACPSDGAIVLNCAGHCREWLVVADEDINSISLQYCDEGEGTVKFAIPPNVTRRITGWPDGFGSSGDEPSIVSGANGRTVSVPIGKVGGTAKPTSSRPGTGTGIGSGGGAGAGSCNCTAISGLLTIKSCNANNSLNCTSTKSLQLIACGGRAPYTWTKTGTISLSKTTGPNTTVTPPANSGSGEAGNAYTIGRWHRCNGGANQTHWTRYGCNDQVTLALQATTSNGAFLTAAPGCEGFITAADFAIPITDHSNPACTPNCDGCPNPTLSGHGSDACDSRSAGMISAGCAPCGLQSGSTVTVTDSIGVQTTIIVRS